MRQYSVCILSNRSRTLHVGVTNGLVQRLYGHGQGQVHGFASRYRTTRLVFCQITPDVRSAIARQRQIKGWSRDKKLALIPQTSPMWRTEPGLASCHTSLAPLGMTAGGRAATGEPPAHS